MLKFILKRKVTGSQLRELKKKAKRSEEIVTDNPLWGKTITYKPIPHRRDLSFDYNSPVGVRKYPPAIYELEEKAPKQAGLGYGSWNALGLILKYKKQGKKGKLKRLYKAYPSYSPEYKRQLKHDIKVKLWQEKLYKNHVQQCQSLR